MNDLTFRIRERYPDKKDRLDLLLAEDAQFISLSEDYNTCIDALRYWAGSNAPEAEARVIEYHTLTKELEMEIFQYLSRI